MSLLPIYNLLGFETRWRGPSADKFIVEKAPRTIRYVPNFISPEEESFFIEQIDNVPSPKWRELSNRRLQNYGGVVGKHKLIREDDIPQWLDFAIEKLISIPNSFPSRNRPNHVLINEYLPGQGILAHTDGPVYYRMVATISLGSDALLDYYRPVNPMVKESKEERYIGSMFLERRSLLLVSDDAYEYYLHEVAERTTDLVTYKIFNLNVIHRSVGEVVERKRRISMTIRNVPVISNAIAFRRRV